MTQTSTTPTPQLFGRTNPNSCPARSPSVWVRRHAGLAIWATGRHQTIWPSSTPMTVRGFPARASWSSGGMDSGLDIIADAGSSFQLTIDHPG
jgi:hypothetical protein